MMPYGEPWKVRRSLFKKNFHVSNPHIYQKPEIKYIHRLLVNLAQRPADFFADIDQYVFTAADQYSTEKLMTVIDRMTGSVAISMTYGLDIRPINDPNLQITKLATTAVSDCLTSGTMVDVFPLLKHLPSWVPGTSFHEKAKVSRQYAKYVREGIYSDARNKMVISLFRYLCFAKNLIIRDLHQANNGVEQESFLSLSLEAINPETDSQDIEIIKDVAANVFMGINLL